MARTLFAVMLSLVLTFSLYFAISAMVDGPDIRASFNLPHLTALWAPAAAAGVSTEICRRLENSSPFNIVCVVGVSFMFWTFVILSSMANAAPIFTWHEAFIVALVPASATLGAFLGSKV